MKTLQSMEPQAPTENIGNVDWPAYVDHMASLHGLVLDTERRTEVIAQMQRIELLARRFLDFELEPHVEPAPVFRP